MTNGFHPKKTKDDSSKQAAGNQSGQNPQATVAIPKASIATSNMNSPRKALNSTAKELLEDRS